ncbi:MAG: Fic family protein [Phycisphaerae bacterium]
MAERATGGGVRAAGYAALVDRHGIRAVPNWHQSVIATTATRRVESMAGGMVRETYGPAYWPGDTDGDHLEFALKYDGTNLAILAQVFKAMDAGDLATFVRERPTGKYARRLWFLYEWITGRRLDIPDLTLGNYIDVLEPEEYAAISPARQVRRQRVNDNLPGVPAFCPLVRRTEAMRAFESADLAGRCEALIATYPADVLKRALSYLYTKETRSSFEIERERPTATRTERFVAILARAHTEEYCDKARLIELQHEIVDPRFRDHDWRQEQNYVGETVHATRERIHYVCPSPADVPSMMQGLIEAHRLMERGGVHPIVHAAVVGYGFVFVHPFNDGNGRIHRFLIHNILARRRFTPEGVMFPVSAAMLKEPKIYDESLEAHSKGIMGIVEYELDEQASMTVRGVWSDWYRFPDLTRQAEALFHLVSLTIERELPEELAFLQGYDRTRGLMQEVVDLPGPLLDLFIRLCVQNGGTLSARKRESHFSRLTDAEIAGLEEAVRRGYAGDEAE